MFFSPHLGSITLSSFECVVNGSEETRVLRPL